MSESADPAAATDPSQTTQADVESSDGAGPGVDAAAAEQSIGDPDRSADGPHTVPPTEPDQPDPAAPRNEAAQAGDERGTPQSAAGRSEPDQAGSQSNDAARDSDDSSEPDVTSDVLDNVQESIDIAKDSAGDALKNRLD